MKYFRKAMITMLLTAPVLAGCGAGETEQVSETAGTPVETAEAQEELVPDTTKPAYLEEYQIKDTIGDGKEYALYAPQGRSE